MAAERARARMFPTAVSVQSQGLVEQTGIDLTVAHPLSALSPRREVAFLGSSTRGLVTPTDSRPQVVGETEQAGAVRNVSMNKEAFRPTTSQLVAEWQGCVTSISDDYFVAEMLGTHGEGVIGSLEEAVVPLEDLRESDKALLLEGAFFRLCISYEVEPTGSKRRFTEVVFRRLPAYRRDTLEVAAKDAYSLSRGIRLE